jgi:uncharacterized membrane protein
VGLITGLLTLPLAPVRGTVWVAELIAAEAERELAEINDPDRALAELEAARATGEISDEEFDRRFAEIVDLVLASQAEEAP